MSLRLSDGPTVQLALDFVNLEPALRAAAEALPAGLTWIEAGTPLIKAVGLEAVRQLRANFPQAFIIADMKVMDAGRVEVEYAKKAGADLVMVLGQTTDATLEECVRTGRHLGVAIGCDLVACPDPVARAKQAEAMGVDLVSVHVPIDQQMQGVEPFAVLAQVAAAVSIPVSCAGGLTAASAARAVAAGARICIVGGTITKAPDARAAAATVLEAVRGGQATAGNVRSRVGLDRIREVFGRISTPNLSDAMHRGGAIRGFTNRNSAVRLCGPVRTCVAAPGDWSKPVQAIDRCLPGEVLVIDAADAYPALWGGLASLTAVQRKLGGVVINGACRDLADITRSGLPLWSTKACPDAGEPRGIGSFDLPVEIGGQQVLPGDWLIGDEDGLVRIPAKQAVEVGNRAADIAEREERLAAEIMRGRSLAEIADLRTWEQR
jgi:3-hexulose-6-phosphate synthase / 6-phospho-3-hexuloisomerase